MLQNQYYNPAKAKEVKEVTPITEGLEEIRTFKPEPVIPYNEMPRSERQETAQEWRNQQTRAWVKAGMPALVGPNGGLSEYAIKRQTTEKHGEKI